jgi:hypothetical protein
VAGITATISEALSLTNINSFYAAHSARQDKEAALQQELLYNAEFQIQQIERKVARGMGERPDEEKRQLRHQIEACEKKLEEVREKKKKLLLAQSCNLPGINAYLPFNSLSLRINDSIKICAFSGNEL